MKFSAVILAGGRSQRMGQDKAWLRLNGKPLIERQIELVRELGAEEVFISGRADTNYDSLAIIDGFQWSADSSTPGTVIY